MVITLGASILCDGATRALNKSCGPAPGWSISGRISTQPAEALRARNARVYDRGNEITTLQFEVTRLLASIEAAEQWALLHAATVARSGTLTITTGIALRMLLSVLQEPKCTCVGCSVRVAYTINGGGMEVVP